MGVTRDQSTALNLAAIRAKLESRSVAIYTVDVQGNAWGQSREYWIDAKPPQGTPIARTVFVAPDGTVTEIS